MKGNDDLKKRILDVIRNYPVGAVATIKDGKPWVRYMVFFAQDDLTCYTTTFAGSRKLAQIRKNRNVNVAFGCDPKNWGVPYLNLEGTAEIVEDIAVKKRLWSDALKKYYSGPEDPNYVLIRVKPSAFEYMTMEAEQPEVLAVK